MGSWRRILTDGDTLPYLSDAGNDTSAGVITAAGFTTTGSITLGGHAVDDIDLAGEFVDSDNHLMTAAAINDRIQAISDVDTYAQTTFQVEDGDGTEVTISHGKEWKFVEGTGIDINWTDTSDGSDSDPFDLTFSCTLEGEGGLRSTGESGGTKFLREDGDGTCSWQTPSSGVSLSGSTDNTVATVTGSNALAGEATLTYSSGVLTVGAGVLGSIANQVKMQNDEGEGQIGVSNGTDSICSGDADGDFVVNCVGNHDLVFGRNDAEVGGFNSSGFYSKTINAAGASYSGDKILVSDSGVIEYLTGAQLKADMSLNSVENTALSSWAGTTSVTTLGTISTGTWNGADVGIAYGGTGQSTAAAAANALLNVSQGGALAIGDSSDVITIAGDLVVNGTNSSIDVQTLTVEDKLITLAEGGSSTSTGSGSGLLIDTGGNQEPALKWLESGSGTYRKGWVVYEHVAGASQSAINIQRIGFEASTGTPSGPVEDQGMLCYNQADGTMYFYDHT